MSLSNSTYGTPAFQGSATGLNAGGSAEAVFIPPLPGAGGGGESGYYPFPQFHWRFVHFPFRGQVTDHLWPLESMALKVPSRRNFVLSLRPICPLYLIIHPIIHHNGPSIRQNMCNSQIQYPGLMVSTRPRQNIML